jgi:hypothetical protein
MILRYLQLLNFVPDKIELGFQINKKGVSNRNAFFRKTRRDLILPFPQRQFF